MRTPVHSFSRPHAWHAALTLVAHDHTRTDSRPPFHVPLAPGARAHRALHAFLELGPLIGTPRLAKTPARGSDGRAVLRETQSSQLAST